MTKNYILAFIETKDTGIFSERKTERYSVKFIYLLHNRRNVQNLFLDGVYVQFQER